MFEKKAAWTQTKKITPPTLTGASTHNDVPLEDWPKQYYIFKSVSLLEKFNFYEYLATMLDWGVTVISALDSVQRKMKNQYFKERIQEILEDISSGDSLNKAMKKQVQIFNASEYAIVEAGEQSGNLIHSLKTLAHESKKVHELKQTVKTALTYPTIIVCFLILAVIIVMTYVVPTIIPLIEQAGVEKPMATVALIATSDFLRDHFIALGVGIGMIVILGMMYGLGENGRHQFDKLYLHLPLIGEVYRNYILASGASTLWLLVSSGIPVIRSIQLVGKSANNAVYDDLYTEIGQKVSHGKKIVNSMSEVDPDEEYFPGDFVQLLSVGEKTATLDILCQKLSDQYTREVNYALGNMTKWIEPIAILLAGVFVLWFAFAIFGAVLQLTQTVG